nr:actin protein 8 [Hymenolepis microstoma]
MVSTFDVGSRLGSELSRTASSSQVSNFLLSVAFGWLNDCPLCLMAWSIVDGGEACENVQKLMRIVSSWNHQRDLEAPWWSPVYQFGTATDSEPKVLLNCIARKSTRGCPGKITERVKPKCPISFESGINEDILCCLKSFDGADHVVLKDELYDIFSQGSSGKPCSNSGSRFVPFIEGFKVCDGDTYELQWPVLSGHLNDKFTITENVQSLADMWSYALTEYFSIPYDRFPKYSVLLAIDDIFIRREVRYIIDKLMKELKFSRFMVLPTSYLHMGGTGSLSNCCIVDLGFYKTTISCLINGISLLDVRVNLPCGGIDGLEVLRAALDYYSPKNPELSELFTKYDHGSYNDVCQLLSAMHAADSDMAMRLATDSLNAVLSRDIVVTLGSGCTLTLPALAVVKAHLSPFFPLQTSPEGSLTNSLKPQYQVHPTDAPEPDDPLDDYCSRKRRFPFDDENEESALPKSTSSSKFSKPSEFRDLAEAIAWSIRNATVTAASTSDSSESEAVQQQQPIAAGISVEQPSAATDTRNEQLRQKIASCIILVGGGAEGINGLLLRRVLAHKLQRLLGEDFHVNIFTRPQSIPDSAWQGARIAASADFASDLWISKKEWEQLGSRTLREKGAFLW